MIKFKKTRPSPEEKHLSLKIYNKIIIKIKNGLKIFPTKPIDDSLDAATFEFDFAYDSILHTEQISKISKQRVKVLRKYFFTGYALSFAFNAIRGWEAVGT